MPYISDEPEIPVKEKTRSSADFLRERRAMLLYAGADPKSAEILFLEWVIAHINDRARITKKSEIEITNGVDWKYWSEGAEDQWALFVNIINNSFHE
jgi:hypothetical protein